MDEFLAKHRDLGPLWARADAGDTVAAHRLADLLAERGDVEGLRARTDTDDGIASHRLTKLLAEQGDLDGLRREVAAGVPGDVGALRALEARADNQA